MGVRKAKATAWGWFSKYIRLRDALETTKSTTHAKCCTCDKVYPLNEIHAGHFIAGRNDAVLFDETGVHAQCHACNTFKGGDPSNYGKFMTRKYGEGIIEQKFQESWKIQKRTEADYREISDTYREKYKELNTRVFENNISTEGLPF
jgi:hypothetical protein